MNPCSQGAQHSAGLAHIQCIVGIAVLASSFLASPHADQLSPGEHACTLHCMRPLRDRRASGLSLQVWVSALKKADQLRDTE